MSITKTNLRNMIKDLECRAAVLTADKYSKSLKYGIGCIDCVHNKLTIARGAINVLKRFYADGKDCEGSCDLEGATFVVTSACTADPNAYYSTITTPYTCYYIFNNSGDTGEVIVGSSLVFGSSTVVATKPTGVSTTHSYTYDSSTSLITVIGIITASAPAIFTYTPSDDCTSASIVLTSVSSTATFHGVTYELYGTLSNISSDDCDWTESCITEEEAVDLYKNTSLLIGKKCNCN